MKFFLSFSLLLFSFTLFSQNTIGKIITSTGDEIQLFEGKKKKKKMSKMENGCDCQNTAKNTILYINAEGKVATFKQKEIDKLILDKGAVYCMDATQSGMGSASMSHSFQMELPEEMIYPSLPISKKGLKAIQTVLIQNDKYVLSLYQGANMSHTIYITAAKDGKYIDGKFNYFEVGYKKGGEQSLAAIKKYFKGCDEAMSIINENLAHNKKVKRFKMVPVLQGVMGISCN